MSIQPVALPTVKNTVMFIHQPYSASIFRGKIGQDTVQFGHKHAHGKTCTDHSCHDHHHHDHPPKPAANNVFSKAGLWLSEFFGGMLTDLQKLGKALLHLFGIKPKPDKGHHHTHDESCQHHHH